MLTPYRTERMVKAFNAVIGLPIHIHCHYVGGMAPANIIKAAEAGAAIADTAHAPLAFGNSHPAVEMIVAALQESRYDTGLDLDLLFEIAEYWEEVRKRGHYKRGVSSLMHMQVYSHQVPGGMMSNLVSQLEIQNAADRLPEVMREIPKVRAEVGYPPLVTPHVADRGHAGRVQRAHGQALERGVQGDEGTTSAATTARRRAHGQGHRGEGGGQLRNAAARRGSGVAGDHHLRRGGRRDWRLGQNRGKTCSCTPCSRTRRART